MTELQNKDSLNMTPTNKRNSFLDNSSTNLASSEVKLETHKYMSNDSGTSLVHKDPVATFDNTEVERLENKASNNRDFEEVQCNDIDYTLEIR